MKLDDQLRRLERKLDKIAKDSVPKAYAAAVNKVATQSRTAIASEVAREVRIPVRAVKSRIYLRRARVGGLEAQIRLYARPVDAVNTGPARLSRGWKVAGQFRERSFMARMPNQNRHRIYQRAGADRLPIQKVVVPISEPVERIGMAVTALKMRRDFARLYKHELDARIKGYVTRGR